MLFFVKFWSATASMIFIFPANNLRTFSNILSELKVKLFSTEPREVNLHEFVTSEL